MLLWVAVFVGLVCWAILKWVKFVTDKDLPPGPNGIPFFYNLWSIIWNMQKIYEWEEMLLLKYGHVTKLKMSTGIPIFYMMTDPACVSYVLNENFDNYPKGSHLYNNLKDLLGNGIFNVDGHAWKQQRQVASHLFTVKELKEYVDIFAKHGMALVQHLKTKAASKEPVDMQDLFSRCTLDSIGLIAFGTDVGSLDHDVPFATAFNDALICIDRRFFNPVWKLMPFWPTEIKLRKAVKVVNEYAYQLISQRRKDPHVGEGKDLLSRYISMKDTDGSDFSDVSLRDTILNFLIAGRDTTAQALTWLFYLLSQNLDKEAKLVDEIKQTLQGKLPTYESLKGMKYLQACVDETLRLYPSVPVDIKTTLKDDVLPNGMKIKAGTSVAWHQWAMGRHPDFWDAPKEFRPERWFGTEFNGGKQLPVAHRPPYIPFQYGPRTCLGMNFAYLEIKVVACLILQSLRLRLVPNYPVEVRSTITISSRYGVKMTAETI